MANDKIPYLNVLPYMGSANPSSPYAASPSDDGTSGRNYTSRTVQWQGLDRRAYIDTGTLTDASGVTMKALPYLEGDNRFVSHYNYASGTRILSLAGIGDALVVIYYNGADIKLDVFSPATETSPTATGTIKENAAEGDLTQRSIVQFNVYTTPTDPIGGEFDRKVLIFPDKLSMDYVTEVSGTISFARLGDTYPDIKMAAVKDSRLFGVDDARIYASAANNYADWTLDTATDTSSAHAWCSPTQADSRADGTFTAIASYGGHIVAFKEDFTHELYNNKNPFYLQELFNYGTIDRRTVQEVAGRLLFVSRDGVISYGGGSPQLIDAPLCSDGYTEAVSGTYDGVYFLTVNEGDRVVTYTYNSENGAWSIHNVGNTMPDGYVTVGGNMYMAINGGIKRLSDTKCDFFFDTDIKTNGTLDVKALTRILLLCDFKLNSGIEITLPEDDNRVLYYFDCRDNQRRMMAVRLPVTQSMRHYHVLRISGYGDVRIHNMELVYRTGGRLYGDTT